jgi:hypothetical protein
MQTETIVEDTSINDEPQEESFVDAKEEIPEDDYEYDYEYDDYDFDKDENDYTEEEQAYFDQTTIQQEKVIEESINADIEINTINPVEGTAPNIQAISAVPDVTEQQSLEENTGSSLLTDPGIRIADDGSINQSAEINANPILPNYED